MGRFVVVFGTPPLMAFPPPRLEDLDWARLPFPPHSPVPPSPALMGRISLDFMASHHACGDSFTDGNTVNVVVYT